MGLNFHKYFNLKLVSDKTGINKDKLYNNLSNSYTKNTLSDQDKKNILNVLNPAINEMISFLDFDTDKDS